MQKRYQLKCPGGMLCQPRQAGPTRLAEAARKQHGIPDWVEEVHRRRYKWVSTVVSREDDRWTKAIMHWTVSGERRRGRPLTRWSDSFKRFFEHVFDSEGTSAKGSHEWMPKTQRLGSHLGQIMQISCENTCFYSSMMETCVKTIGFITR